MPAACPQTSALARAVYTSLSTKCVVYLEHSDRKEYDCVVIKRQPNHVNEEGNYYIAYYADVPSDTNPNTLPNKRILLADGVKTVIDYIDDLFDLLLLDMRPFSAVEVQNEVYPNITLSLDTIRGNRSLLGRCIEDSLRSECVSQKN